MMSVDLFPFQQYWWFYAAFTAFVLLLLALDLGVFHRDSREVRFREATIWCVVWVSLALAFAYGFYRYALWRFPRDPRLAGLAGFDPTAAARDTALEFLTGYIVEYSLSVDNIFIFVLVLSYFAIPARHQHRVLFYGILGALVSMAWACPRQRPTIQLSTRMFSPNPGQTNLPVASLRNQLTWKMCGGHFTFLPTASQCLK